MPSLACTYVDELAQSLETAMVAGLRRVLRDGEPRPDRREGQLLVVPQANDQRLRVGKLVEGGLELPLLVVARVGGRLGLDDVRLVQLRGRTSQETSLPTTRVEQLAQPDPVHPAF